MEQRIITIDGSYAPLLSCFAAHQSKRILLVCDGAFRYLPLAKWLDSVTSPEIVPFDDFRPNPAYESVVNGVRVFRENGCDLIFAVGGGSAIDVAKCIKLYAGMAEDRSFLKQDIIPNDIPLIAMPTTAGTGSEATRYAVIYDQGEKQSVSHVSCIPGTVIFDPAALRTLPDYQRKSTMLDALCHAVESFWSVNATAESRGYAGEAIREILFWKKAYLANEDHGNAGMLRAANLAGKAINISQTTAGHAMCYKLTGLYGCAHGHAAALCVRVLWPWMLKHTDRCIDPKGAGNLAEAFYGLASCFGTDDPEQAAVLFAQLFDELELSVPKMKPGDLEKLSVSVNPVRLKNHPVSLEGCIPDLYQKILR